MKLNATESNSIEEKYKEDTNKIEIGRKILITFVQFVKSRHLKRFLKKE